MKTTLWGWICPCGEAQPKTMSQEGAASAAQAHDREAHGGERSAIYVSTANVSTG